MKVLTWGVQRHPRSAPLRVALAAGHYSLSEYELTAAIVCDAVDADPADLRTLPFLADFRAISPRHAVPIRQRLKNYVDRYPGNAFARLHRAMMLDDAGREPELRAALNMDATLPGPALELAVLLLSRRRFAEAETLLKQAIRLVPASERAHYRLARLYQQTGRHADAREELRTVEKLKRPPVPPSPKALSVTQNRPNYPCTSTKLRNNVIRVRPDAGLPNTVAGVNRVPSSAVSMFRTSAGSLDQLCPRGIV